jgi:hypothetical protein
MIQNGENTNYIKSIVTTVKKHFVGQAEKEQKDIAKQCLTKTVTPVWNKQLNLISNTPFKAGILLFVGLVISRLLPLPANSEPLLGLAVLTPYLTKNNLAFLFPLAVMFVSDIFIGFHNSMLMTYSALALAPFISRALPNKYTSLLASWLVWHTMANAGQYYPPFSIEALVFDIRFLVSGLSIIVLYDIVQKTRAFNIQYNK